MPIAKSDAERAFEYRARRRNGRVVLDVDINLERIAELLIAEVAASRPC
jgi:hypothetical protein